MKDTKGSNNLDSELRALRVLSGEHFLSKIVAALRCWALRGKNIKPSVVDHSNQSFQNQFLKEAN